VDNQSASPRAIAKQTVTPRLLATAANAPQPAIHRLLFGFHRGAVDGCVAEPVVMDDPVAATPDEMAVPAPLAPGGGGKTIFAGFPTTLGAAPKWLGPPLLAGPVVMDDPVVANDPDELAVPALLVPSSSGKAALTELCAPLGALPELLRPPALAGADGTLPKPAADGPAPIAVERELPPPKPPSPVARKPPPAKPPPWKPPPWRPAPPKPPPWKPAPPTPPPWKPPPPPPRAEAALGAKYWLDRMARLRPPSLLPPNRSGRTRRAAGCPPTHRWRLRLRFRRPRFHRLRLRHHPPPPPL
jgi:hypothetical protein